MRLKFAKKKVENEKDSRKGSEDNDRSGGCIFACMGDSDRSWAGVLGE